MNGVAFDASVLINVLASGVAEAILMALPRRLLLVDAVVDEVKLDPRDPEPRDPKPGLLRPLIDDGLLQPFKLPPSAEELFFNLVGAAPPDHLGDGEAAAIAAALTAGVAIATDDSKAIRICRAQFPTLTVVTSVGLFKHPDVVASLGARLPEALMSAVCAGRMRVPKADRPWAKAVLQDLAEHCPHI